MFFFCKKVSNPILATFFGTSSLVVHAASWYFYCVGKYAHAVCVRARRGILLDGSEDAAKVLIKKFCTPVGFQKGLGDELQGEGLAGLLPYIRLGTVSPLWILGVLMLCGKIVPQVCSCVIRG